MLVLLFLIILFLYNKCKHIANWKPKTNTVIALNDRIQYREILGHMLNDKYMVRTVYNTSVQYA
jgi:hypothetical protein